MGSASFLVVNAWREYSKTVLRATNRLGISQNCNIGRLVIRKSQKASTWSSVVGSKGRSATPPATSKCWNTRGAGNGARLMMLVHHDDAKREYAYGAESKIGTFSDALMAEAKTKGWIVISMKDDWKTIFPPTGSKQ
jgi:hypothetical protein